MMFLDVPLERTAHGDGWIAVCQPVGDGETENLPNEAAPQARHVCRAAFFYLAQDRQDRWRSHVTDRQRTDCRMHVVNHEVLKAGAVLPGPMTLLAGEVI